MNDTDTTIRREVTVPVDVARAFATFTERFGEVKPAEHNLLAAPLAETVFQARVGGVIVDRGTDGTECRWARVLVVEAPHRIVFTWDISPSWELETDPAHTSEVEIRFTAVGPHRTRLDLEHRHLERHGRGWTGFREAIAGDDGWPVYLDRFEGLVGAAE